MKKFIVETYYTCTFKTIHTLDNLNDVELSKIDSRKDGEVEVIDVKLNNRKTKKIGDKNESISKKIEEPHTVSKSISTHVVDVKSATPAIPSVSSESAVVILNVLSKILVFIFIIAYVCLFFFLRLSSKSLLLLMIFSNFSSS